MHSAAESASGADVQPYRVHGIAEAGVIVPEMTPMELVRKLAQSFGV